MSKKAKHREKLGEVSVPNGIVLLFDIGMADLWCHDREPLLPPWFLNDERKTASANAGKDYRIEGPDAEAAGRAFDRQYDPFYLYDIPEHGLEGLESLFQNFVEEKGLDAHLVRLPQRITHRERARLTLENCGGAGDFLISGTTFCVARGIPADRPLPVYGERMTEEKYASRWRHVYLECQSDVTIARSDPIGRVVVDKARLMFIDAEVLGEWQHHQSLDGLADFLFWGRDAEKAAQISGAPQINENQWGWENLAVQEAILRGTEIEELQAENEWHFAVDFRPHSHHYQMMQQVRDSSSQSGTIEIGDSRACGFMTTWGDGFYPVYRDLDSNGEVVRIRVDLGNEDIVNRQERMDERWFGLFSRFALVSKTVAEGHAPILRLARVEPHDETDSGWYVHTFPEDDAIWDDPNGWSHQRLRDIIDAHPELEDLFRLPVGARLARKSPEEPFEPLQPENTNE